jgi:hypothetical protein
MQQLVKHNKYLFGLAVALAVACANVVAIVGPCGFKWGWG